MALERRMDEKDELEWMWSNSGVADFKTSLIAKCLGEYLNLR
jgi:hypothetical protein